MKVYTALLSQTPESELKRAYFMMDEARKQAVLRYRGEKDRKRTVLGELLARKAISNLLGVDRQDIAFGRYDSGKPYAKNFDVKFSISHSKDMVVCAVSRDEVGIDVELIRDIDMRITKIACTENDKSFIFGDNGSTDTQDNETVLRFFKLWTAKEAYLKYCGEGISNLKSVNYCDIAPYCTVSIENGYIITVYAR